jgi:hypothetical protein
MRRRTSSNMTNTSSCVRQMPFDTNGAAADL